MTTTECPTTVLVVRTRSALSSLVGPCSFALAAFIGGRLEPGYSRRDESISGLAAKGSRAAPVMVAGFLGLAAGTLGLATQLRGSSAAPPPVPALLGLAGLTTAGAGLARCSDRSCPSGFLGDEAVTTADEMHALFSMATFALWIAVPLVASQRAQGASNQYRRCSRGLGVFTLGTLLLGGTLARRQSKRWSGVAQRLMICSALAWYPVAGTTL
jgi:hypothetical protein